MINWIFCLVTAGCISVVILVVVEGLSAAMGRLWIGFTIIAITGWLIADAVERFRPRGLRKRGLKIAPIDTTPISKPNVPLDMPVIARSKRLPDVVTKIELREWVRRVAAHR